jgi:cell division protein FtsN
MTDHDRGAYTPQTDAPLSFDARRAPSGRPVPMTLLISGMVLVVLLVGVVYFYRSGVRRTNEAPQVIGAPVATTKSAPTSGEQPSDAAAGLQVYKSETAPLSKPEVGPSAAPKFTPAPEQPAPRPLPQPAPPPPAPVHNAAPPAPATPTPKAPIVAAPLAPTLKPAIKATAKAPLVAPAPLVPAQAPATSGAAMVQIGAFSSAALADKGWNDTAKVLPSAMAGKTKTVQVVQKDDKTFYRTSVGGFASKADAVSFCAALKAAGKSCIVK